MSVVTLVACLVLSWLNFSGRLRSDSFKFWFLLLSLFYFVVAALSLRNKSGT